MSTTMNYLHYNKDKFLESFSQSVIFNTLSKKYKYLFSEISDLDKILDQDTSNCGAVYSDVIESMYYRYQTERKNLPESKLKLQRDSVFIYSVFYYLEFLAEKKSKIIADIGCGTNFIKEYIPNIIGFDQTPEADIKLHFNDQFISDNLEKFDSAFSINALHFVSLSEFYNIVNNFGKIIKPGGRGFLAFNLKRMLEHTEPHEYTQLFDLSKRLTAEDYKRFIIKQLENLKYKILVLDILFEDSNIKNNEKFYADKYDSEKGADWPATINEYYEVHNKISSEIKKEIESMMSYTYIDNINDTANGNIRIVFEV